VYIPQDLLLIIISQVKPQQSASVTTD